MTFRRVLNAAIDLKHLWSFPENPRDALSLTTNRQTLANKQRTAVDGWSKETNFGFSPRPRRRWRKASETSLPATPYQRVYALGSVAWSI